MRVVAVTLSVAVAVIALGLLPSTAHASPSICNMTTGVCYLAERKDPQSGGNSTEEGRDGTRSFEADEKRRRLQIRFDTEMAEFNRANQSWRNCLNNYNPAAPTVIGCGPAPQPPPAVGEITGSRAGGGPVITITPAQAGAIAVARLRLPTVAPGIGPSPDLNRWKMAAVGYPLWLWADGPTQVGPVADSVAGLSVSLEAEVSSLTFRMGDGTVVTCPGIGNEWTKAVEPGAKAPSCGHTYTEPSLPRGNYTVAALTNWAVTWTANGQSGVINVPAVQTTELPVGELQVLVR